LRRAEILNRAEDSLAIWPVWRPLKFRDVAQHIVVARCLNADASAAGLRPRLTTILAEEIPAER
jgi:hypothetical protein